MITIRKSVKKEVTQNIPMFLDNALTWMKNKYPDINFSYIDYIFSGASCRSRYFRNNESLNAKYLFPCVCICTREQLYLYSKPSLGMKKTSIWTGAQIQIECALIHELTHHVQYELNTRKGNETDTTANELTYLKEFYPEDYKEITQ
jgi:hypothetical protein